jgi:hypothetical protein
MKLFIRGYYFAKFLNVLRVGVLAVARHIQKWCLFSSYFLNVTDRGACPIFPREIASPTANMSSRVNVATQLPSGIDNFAVFPLLPRISPVDVHASVEGARLD